MTTLIWYRDPQDAFFNPEKIVKILPDTSDPLEEQLNSVMRFSIYLGVLISLLHRSIAPFVYVVVVSTILTIGINYYNAQTDGKKDALMEKLNVQQDDFDKFCTVPTKANPFMNLMPGDHANFPTRPEACDVSQPGVQKAMETKFNDKLYRNSDDIYGRESSSRQFYTMPVSTIPSNQVEFAEWLYLHDDIDGVCRDGDMLACSRNVGAQRR